MSITAPTSSAPVLISTRRTDFVADLQLPSTSTNLFHRLIRNPRPDSNFAKERECTEMLCALLQNAPVVRDTLLTWMASQAGLSEMAWETLALSFETEQPIGPKRDDLRITGWDAADTHRLLWTVEVKVGASIHLSSPLVEVNEEAAEASAAVSQIENYDRWLVTQTAEQRAGFVVALHDCTAFLPSNLKMNWTCLTWTGIGEQLARVLTTIPLVPHEQFLAKHVLGFIRENLWRVGEMSETRLDFNDVALIRAFGMLATTCEEKVNRLVAPLIAVLSQSSIGTGPVKHTKSLFNTGSMHSVVYRTLAKDAQIYAGIGAYEEGDYLSVWIQSLSRHPVKESLKSALAELESKLKARNPAWKVTPQHITAGWAAWVDLELTVPLARLLAAEDQVQEVKGFIHASLEDLKACGVIDAFNRTMGTATC